MIVLITPIIIIDSYTKRALQKRPFCDIITLLRMNRLPVKRSIL